MNGTRWRTRWTGSSLWLLAIGVLGSRAGVRHAEAGEANTGGPPTVITHATVHPVSRPPIRRGTVIWQGGKILDVGPELPVPEGATVIPGDGLHVTPGLVAVIAAGLGAEDTQGDIQHSLDPYDLELRIALANGVTTAQLFDQRFGGFFGDEGPLTAGSNSAVIKLAYGDLEAMLVREPALNYFALPSRQLEVNLYEMRERFRRAAEHLKKREEAKAKKENPPAMDRELGPYVTVLENERPTVFTPRSNEEARAILALKEEHGFDAVLYQPDDAWQIAPLLAAKQVPVLVKSRGPDFQFEQRGKVLEEGDMAPVRRPAAFARAGVEVSILPYRRGVALSGLAGRDLSTLAIDAAFAVRGGLSEEEALRAITLNPAKVLKIDDRVGSLDEGKDADLLILSGEPLDYRTYVLKAFIGGKLYYEREKSRLYRQVPLASEK